MLPESSELQSAKTDEDLLMPGVPVPKRECALESGSLMTVLSGCRVRNKPQPQVARILLLHDKDKRAATAPAANGTRCATPGGSHSHEPLSPFQQKLVSTAQSYELVLRDGVNQGADGLHDAEELLVCDGTNKESVTLSNPAEESCR